MDPIGSPSDSHTTDQRVSTGRCRKILPTVRSFTVGLTRDAFYKVEKRTNKQCLQEALVLGEVCKIKEEQLRIGTEKVNEIIKPFLSEHGIKMGRDKLYALLRAYHLLPKRKRKGPGTTQSRYIYYKHPNLVRDLEVLRPNFVWTNAAVELTSLISAVVTALTT